MNPTETNDGGSYHPHVEYLLGNHWDGQYAIHQQHPGASLRDEFAKAAMHGVISTKLPFQASVDGMPSQEIRQMIARASYLMADEMLIARALPAPPKEVQA